MPVLEILPLIEDIRVSRVKGKTLFEMAETDPSLSFVCDYYLNIADYLAYYLTFISILLSLKQKKKTN